MVFPSSIEEVIFQLEQIIEECEKRGSREVYFAALYLRVTKEIRNKINEKYFDDNERMELLDVVFANRYIAAYHQYRQNQACSASWGLAFETCQKWRPIVMQHLLAGMNAHIGLDLGIAAATVCPGASIESLRNDFDKINIILGGMVNSVQAEISQIWPLLKPIDFLAWKLDEKLAVFSMEIARKKAWKVAVEYAPLELKEHQEKYFKEHDKRVAAFGKKMVRPGIILTFIITIIRVLEHGNVKSKIKVLKGTKRKENSI
ncbi:MAG TPA: DUF5995 family protein [Saprospiraceae bacterium]|nr:DUF5995 family protein [Saprospiraceae bacterium]